MADSNFLELDNIGDANRVDLTKYRWSERMSAKTGKYVFILRAVKLTDKE